MMASGSADDAFRRFTLSFGADGIHGPFTGSTQPSGSNWDGTSPVASASSVANMAHGKRRRELFIMADAAPLC